MVKMWSPVTTCPASPGVYTASAFISSSTLHTENWRDISLSSSFNICQHWFEIRAVHWNCCCYKIFQFHKLTVLSDNLQFWWGLWLWDRGALLHAHSSVRLSPLKQGVYLGFRQSLEPQGEARRLRLAASNRGQGRWEQRPRSSPFPCQIFGSFLAGI